MFFAETAQATVHRCDIILHALVKMGMWVTADACRVEGECASGLRAGFKVLENRGEHSSTESTQNKFKNSKCVCHVTLHLMIQAKDKLYNLL